MLGKKRQRVIPACVVKTIRKEFPEEAMHTQDLEKQISNYDSLSTLMKNIILLSQLLIWYVYIYMYIIASQKDSYSAIIHVICKIIVFKRK